MSIDKEELYRIVNGEKPMPGMRNLSNEDPPIAMNILRGVIALIEIRESIDDLRSSINDLGNQLEIRNTLGAKDTRSAGIG